MPGEGSQQNANRRLRPTEINGEDYSNGFCRRQALLKALLQPQPPNQIAVTSQQYLEKPLLVITRCTVDTTITTADWELGMLISIPSDSQATRNDWVTCWLVCDTSTLEYSQRVTDTRPGKTATPRGAHSISSRHVLSPSLPAHGPSSISTSQLLMTASGANSSARASGCLLPSCSRNSS